MAVSSVRTTTIWPALTYGSEKSYFCLRSSVTVTAERTASYAAPSRPAKMPSQAVFLYSTLNPMAAATAFIMSMSKPTMAFVSSTNSIGGKEASLATTNGFVSGAVVGAALVALPLQAASMVARMMTARDRLTILREFILYLHTTAHSPCLTRRRRGTPGQADTEHSIQAGRRPMAHPGAPIHAIASAR